MDWTALANLLATPFISFWEWVVSMASAGQIQQKDDQIQKDANEIQALKDMAAIKQANAPLSPDELMQQLRDQTSLREPLP